MNDYFNEQLYNERSDIFDFNKLDKFARIRECAPEMFELLKAMRTNEAILHIGARYAEIDEILQKIEGEK